MVSLRLSLSIYLSIFVFSNRIGDVLRQSLETREDLLQSVPDFLL